MAENLGFIRVLDEMEALHSKKNADYATADDPYSNFEHAAKAAGMTVMQVFDVLLGVKQARLVELTAGGKVPNNESIRDTLLDRAVYAAIAVAYYDKTHEVDPAEYARKSDLEVTLTNIDAMIAKNPAPWPHMSAVLNPRRYIVDMDTFPPPNPVVDAADFRTESE
jgi:hypothetical protein